MTKMMEQRGAADHRGAQRSTDGSPTIALPVWARRAGPAWASDRVGRAESSVSGRRGPSVRNEGSVVAISTAIYIMRSQPTHTFGLIYSGRGIPPNSLK